MQEVEIGGNRYRTGKLDAFKQFHLFRKLMPVLSGMGETFSDMPEGEVQVNEKFWSAMGPVATAVAEMSQQDSEFILKTCLQTVSLWNGATWVRITAANGDLMFEDIDMMGMLQLTFEVIKDNLGSFFGAPLPNGSAAGESTFPSPTSE
jgi:Phage tail assembly chaperone protein, TAC